MNTIMHHCLLHCRRLQITQFYYMYVGFLGHFSTTYYSEHGICMCVLIYACHCLQVGPCVC